MADRLLDIKTDLVQVAKIKTKLSKFAPFAINEGLDEATAYLNDDEFRESMYPEQKNFEPFIWSSDKQRRAFFATNGFGRGIPTQRTHELMYSGLFKADKKYSSLWITYENIAPYAKWVIGQFTQIVGHIARGWKPANTYVISKGGEVRDAFEKGVARAWAKMSKIV